MSVIIGVFHMSIGISVKGFNAVFNSEKLVLIFEVIGGLVILLGLFGWMDFLIIYKWAWYTMDPYSTELGVVQKLNLCPAIINTMINNFLE